MGWKTINGRRYFHKTEREGGRIKTTYCGAGESGLLISRMESVARAELVCVSRTPGRPPVVTIQDVNVANG